MEEGLWEETGPASVLRENILAAWRFKAVGTDEIRSPKKGSEAWVAQASQRDMEILTRALQRELNSTPNVEKAIDASSITDLDDTCRPDAKHKKFTPGGLQGGSDHSHNLSSDVASSASMSCCSETDRLSRPGSPAQGHVLCSGTRAGGEPSRAAAIPAGTISDSLGRMIQDGRSPRAKCTDNYEQNSNVGSSQPITGKISKKRSRGSNKSPVTILKADPANFREMVQRVTSVDMNNIRGSNTIHQRASYGNGSIPVLKPQPKRPNRINYIPGLPTLDTSSCLNAMDPPGSYDYYLDQLVNNNNNSADDRPRMMMRFGFDPAGDFIVSPNHTDYFCHYESLKFPMNQQPAALPSDFGINSPHIKCSNNNYGDTGKFIPLGALNIGFTNQTISAESDQGAFSAPENSLPAMHNINAANIPVGSWLDFYGISIQNSQRPGSRS